jgi:hypothetical protein
VKRSFVLFLMLVVACGKRGDPHPPVPIIPQATSDLVVAQRGTKVILSWSYPALTTAGQKLTGVRRVVVYRYVEELQVTQPPRDIKTLLPGDIDTTIPPAMALFAKVPAPGPSQFAKLRQRLDSIEGANLPTATVGARLVYEDEPQFHTSDGRPVRLDYAVATETNTATGTSSNLATIVPLDVPVPPGNLVATAKAEGVALAWQAPQAVIAGSEKPRITGYNVYRVVQGQTADELTAPINSAPIGQTTYTDAPAYGTYEYRVTAVAAAGPPRIESDPSAAVSATFKDLVPPATPTGLTALVETGAVRLVWDPVEVADLAGYKVYRIEGSGIPISRISKPLLLTPTPITTTYYRDTGVELGISYYYQITAIDKSGNESAPAKIDWVLVPKTP